MISERKKVLVVDDPSTMRQLVKMMPARDRFPGDWPSSALTPRLQRRE